MVEKTEQNLEVISTTDTRARETEVVDKQSVIKMCELDAQIEAKMKEITGMTVDAVFYESPYISKDWLSI